ncbi:MAG: FHA domain-containing protein, partial [Isosphaeraceae bacterium]|nr:FHA domain-containing protein [Isosphaeraceae bacterium]
AIPRIPPSTRPTLPMASARRDNPGPGGRLLLWADAIGGYLVCLEDEVVLGRAGSDSQADVPLLGDLSRQHATLVRDGDSYVLRARHATFVNGRSVEAAPLRDGDVIRLGPSVELEFHQPSPISATARLEILSRHRLPVAVNGIILMAETCILGPSAQAHIQAPNLAAPVVLYRQGTSLWCRAAGTFEVDGRPCVARAPLTLRSSVLGEDFSFSLEPLGSWSSSGLT